VKQTTESSTEHKLIC